MSGARIAVGPFSNWLLFRVISLAAFIAGLAVVVYNLRPFELQFFCVGTFVSLIGLAGFHDQIYGVADEDGIHYRQYFASRFLKWEDIATISWAHAGLVYFHLKG
jgi:PH (Pleckstrin Homology) domain-containing protein